MKVVKAQYAGACYGVQRALDLAFDAISHSERVFTLGPLIHNPQAVSDLAACGVHAVSDMEQVKGGPLIIRSHGVAPSVRRAIEAKGVSCIDATCPHVARAQKAAADLARRCKNVVVVGEAGHPEVEGLVAYAREAGGRVFTAVDPSDIPNDVGRCVGVVVQTTQTRTALDAVVAVLRDRHIEPEVKDTICFATRQRQESAAALAARVDVMVVVGGRNSSNTTRLAEICAAVCPHTYHIENVDELKPLWFKGCGTVGVTAGASTPETQIAAVVKRLEAL